MPLRTLILWTITFTIWALERSSSLAAGHQSTGIGHPALMCHPWSVFSVDMEENSLERWSKVNGLSETGISAISVDATTQQVIVFIKK